MMFDGPHLLYIFVSLFITVILLYLATRFLKKPKHKDVFLKVFAALTVFLHLLPLWV
jgi:heme O synthase-like polyprenyltransferase